ncbi:hypothetical protein AGMMS49944_00730 [Spirochaetia bacterium]|nr:hypothetical protein AGMMS49944_00730 [Spirochaetia bacterium]
MKKLCITALLGMTLSLPGVFAAPALDRPMQSAGMSAGFLKLVNTAVFEVVVEKSQTDPTVYEQELDWERVPYKIRTDKYNSIGTAFAISETELITAFHVVNLGVESMTYDRYFIRDSEGQVYELDQINAGSNEKDFVIFTVKDRTFPDYFEFEERFETNDPVFSIGNALGEGIVIRNGLILGTVPEDESGRWNRLKSSADVNPGNSGGPLVTPGGKVVSLVTHKADNILYSIRPGTENTAGACALADCMERFAAPQRVAAEASAARERWGLLIRALRTMDRCTLIPEDRRDDDERFSPWILQAGFRGLPGEVMARALDDAGFAVSTGSACSARSPKRPVLEAMGIRGDRSLEGIRISQGWTTSMEEIELLIAAIAHILEVL